MSDALKPHPEFSAFVDTIARLRAPGGCPWDREQTHASIARNMLEEAYEAVDAIEAGDITHLREELGDVLLQVVLQCQIATDNGAFTIDDVCRDINAKIVRRHPHVFGDAVAGSPTEVLDSWDRIKIAERAVAAQAQDRLGCGATSTNDAVEEGKEEGITSVDPVTPESFLDGVPTGLPALMQAQKISRKVIGIGFEWETIDDIWAQVFSEIEELRDAYDVAPTDERGKVTVSGEPQITDGISVSAKEAVELEVGDVLFTFTNVAQRMGIDAETALRASCAKFRSRWAYIEDVARAQGRRIEDVSTAEMNALWREAKQRPAIR